MVLIILKYGISYFKIWYFLFKRYLTKIFLFIILIEKITY